MKYKYYTFAPTSKKHGAIFQFSNLYNIVRIFGGTTLFNRRVTIYEYLHE